MGGDIVTIEGSAEVMDGAPPGLLETYLAKYGSLIQERLGTDPVKLADQYAVTIRITPTRTRTW